ncbi:hypothetical protein ACFW9O_17575 [Streptomyces sp. NPDC059499]|uniref:hypothetical protein n=1 Tax=Streptomyces sp. NPDC059499 TaxID=3346852 RepID=UPI0036A1D921
MNARDAVRKALLASTGTATPEWRECFSTDGSDEPTGIAPVCTDEDHEPDDGSVYNCCPEPVIECGSHSTAAYVVELLNADRGAA